MKVFCLAVLLACAQARRSRAEDAPSRPPQAQGVLAEMTRAYVPFRTSLHDRRRLAVENKLAALSKAVLAAGALADDYSKKRRQAQPAASTETARELLVIDASLDEAARDLRDINEALERARDALRSTGAATVPRSALDPFRQGLSGPYKDLYRRLETLRDRFEALGKAAPR